MILIGSQALSVMGFLDREPRDIDIIGTVEEFAALHEKLDIVHSKQSKRGRTLFAVGYDPIEFEFQHDDFLNDFTLGGVDLGFGWCEVAGLNLLYALKMSHRYLKNSPHFKKTMDDIRRIRAAGILDIHPDLQLFYRNRRAQTYTYSHPKLNQSKDKFFADDGVNYVYDHDSIHLAVATLGDRPAYEMIKKDAADVFCSKEKFMEAPEAVKLATVLEESYVLALERAIIPHSTNVDVAFKKALEKVCTSIASGWWREWSWENYEKVLALYNPDYYFKFLDARDAGIIRPYK